MCLPKEFLRCRLQLLIEYTRLLAWGDVVGLIGIHDAIPVASNLGPDPIMPCSMVSHIGSLLQNFEDWEDTIQPRSAAIEYVDEEGLSIVDERTNATSLIQQVSSDLVNTHDQCVRWNAVDDGVFEKLLKDIHSCTEGLHQLFDKLHEQRIYETTAKMYREMVILSNELEELEAMSDAVKRILRFTTDEERATVTSHDRIHETFRDLLLLKGIKCISNQGLLRISSHSEHSFDADTENVVGVTRYDGAQFFEHFTTTGTGKADSPSRQNRVRGILTKNSTKYNVWVEWKPANVLERSVEESESRLRTICLAQMLCCPVPRELFSPTCIGFVDDPEQSYRFGWIFSMPEGSHEGTSLKTLYSVLGQSQYKPSLSQRISLSLKLATSLLSLHTANWLHKGIHSGNVLFACEERMDLERPILSGFDYSRPSTDTVTAFRTHNASWDLYRWPSLQNEPPRAGASRKKHDVYSLGLVLLEIAHWKPLRELMCLKKWPVPASQNVRVRSWLLGEEGLPPFVDENPLHELRNIAGDQFAEVTRMCLDGAEYDSEEGIAFHTTFNGLVIEKLKGVSASLS